MPNNKRVKYYYDIIGVVFADRIYYYNYFEGQNHRTFFGSAKILPVIIIELQEK